MSLLIAGYGDLGQQIAQQWQLDSHGIHGPIMALRRHPDNQDNSTGVRQITADLSNRSSLTSLDQEISHVIYCAGADRSDEPSYRQTYVDGLKNLLDHIQQQPVQPRVLFVSSTAVYAKALAGMVDESSPTLPERFNGQIMLEAEQMLLQRLPQSIVLRLSGIYGPGRHFLLRRLQAGAATVPDTEGYWANRIHIEDAARAALHLVSRPDLHGVYIGTDDKPLPLDEVYYELAQRVNAPMPKKAPASSLMGKKRLSNHKLRSTGFQCRWPDSRIGYLAVVDDYLAKSKPGQ